MSTYDDDILNRFDDLNVRDTFEQETQGGNISFEPKPRPKWFDDLNPSQLEAVENIEGACLVLAGAGTGKTKILTTRLANILYQDKARPHQILCVTFTNKAAAEMKELSLIHI